MDDLDVSRLMTVQEAIDVIDAAAVEPRVVRKPLAAAYSHRLAADVKASGDHPPFEKSLMDGYAVRSIDVPANGATVRLIEGESAAGRWPDRPLQAGETLPIMTGAPLPPGADGVVPLEQVVAREATFIDIAPGVKPTRHVARRGGDCPAGAVVLRRGVWLGAAQIAAAATVGVAALDVFERPRVAVLSTGDELIPPGEAAKPGQIYNSNSPMLVALLESLGCEPIAMGVAPDDPEIIRERLKVALEYDAAFVSGGMSVGRHDHAPRLLRELGVRLHIEKLRIKPGKPFVFGQRADSRGFAFGLPGNPVSAYVCALRLAARLLTRMAGGEPGPKLPRATLNRPLPANGSREFYQPAVWVDDDRLEPLEWKGSGDVFTLARSDALIVRPIDAPPVAAGEWVHYLESPR